MSDKVNYIIYVARNSINNKEYIGATKRGLLIRKKQHLADARSARNVCPKFHKAIRKYGEDAFVWEEIASGLTLEDAMAREVAEINQRLPAYNTTSGGRGLIGLKRTPEWNEKIRQKLKGRKSSPEAIENLRIAMTGKRLDPVTCLEDGLIFNGRKDAAAYYEISHRSVCAAANGKQVTGGGRHFLDGRHNLTEEQRHSEIERLDQRYEQVLQARIDARSRKVVCLTTGEMFISGVHASRALGLSVMRVSQLCRKGGATKTGLRFRFEDAEEVIPPARSPEKIEAGKRSRVEKLKARRHPPEAIERMRIAAKVRGISEAARIANSAAKIKKIRCVETGEIFDHAKAAGDALGLKRSSIYALLSVPGKKCGAGFSFEHLSEAA